MKIFVFIICLTSYQLCSGCIHEFNNKTRSTYDRYHYHRYETTVIDCTIICSNVYSISEIFYQYEEHNYEQFLKITDSNVTTLQSNEFAKSFPNIDRIYLTGIHIKEIIPGAFGGLLKLKELYLDRNELTKISEGVFSSLEELKILDLSHNKIHQVVKFAFKNTPLLSKLRLQDNNLSKIDEGINNLELLTFLDLSGNPIERVKLDDLPNLEYLCLNKTLFKGFGDLTNATRLRLKLLNMTSNQVTNVDFSKFPKADTLDLSDNNITLIENSQNITIEKLCIKNNSIRHIKTGFYNLNYLTLSHNKLESINQTLLNNSRYIYEVDVSFNKISMIEPNAFKNLHHLRILNLGNNNISGIEMGLLNDLRGLESLSLAFNNIKEIKYGIFHNLFSLHYLDISHNKILKLDLSVFLSLSTLDSLDFSYNKISSFELNYVSSRFHYLRSVYIQGNFWKCKQLAQMYGMLERKWILKEGDSYDVENFKGIACQNDDFFENITPNFINVSVKKLQEHINEGVKNSELQRFLNEDFNNSKFAKYFRKFNGEKFNFSSNDTTVEQETRSLKTETGNSGILILSSTLQVVMCCVLIFISFGILEFWKKVNQKRQNRKISQVPLCPAET